MHIVCPLLIIELLPFFESSDMSEPCFLRLLFENVIRACHLTQVLRRRRLRLPFFVPLSNSGFPVSFSPLSKKNLEPTSEGGEEAAHATRLAHIRESLVLPADATTKRQRTTTFPSYKDSKDREELKSGPQVARQSSSCQCLTLLSK